MAVSSGCTTCRHDRHDTGDQCLHRCTGHWIEYRTVRLHAVSNSHQRRVYRAVTPRYCTPLASLPFSVLPLRSVFIDLSSSSSHPEHPLIGRVVSAQVNEGLPCYTIEPKDNPSSGQEQEYSFDALAVREENLSLLIAYNKKKWRKDVACIGLQIHPVTKQWDATVTWKSDSKVVLVSRRGYRGC